ncbi:putative periplasmic serine endoprotease DegP-like [Chelatococcus asaccharovorans]|uniref:Probable periplasmic serine endoprotease DegP-like n=2 Tax=Chelatococcus asaccharovorans TaxID=28210 RepID=A0A2V3U188_9HYPH|nr:DegQ family serine endoprotease [Chelatococcus asaccharovorans]MBS7704275.1 DegQ family serine endoprotease [Chelatococcus asaccharovorans]PXW55849.1 serine protease Do [Chelatococcus asaccharovorans]CAH1664977.1 putative periplasmic serine endoprotease DegP-like [Chelatococcus asaccharovorans]CAH1682175.1 putative periplasmic serine endoprotease DegP-like [Chelatococcus asaccharovorans]
MAGFPTLSMSLVATKARRVASAIAIVSAVTLAAPLPASARGPESFADLADQVTDAVVNISAATTGGTTRERAMPQLPPGTPFEDLFEEFFKRRGQGGDAPQAPRRASSLGSGFVIDSTGIIVTNNHVIGEANEITAIFNDGTRLKAELLGKDAKLDLAVLKVKPDKPLKAVKFGDSDKLRIGDWVIAIGNPFGLGGSVSAGIVSAHNRNIDQGPYDNYIQTDAAINRGNSGGPLFNMAGEVVGINTAILSPTGGSVGIGFAVPSSMAATVVDQLREFGETRRGWLGVRIQGVDDQTAEALGLEKARGALVAGVDEKGPAKPIGMEIGDVIVKFDGKDVKSARDLPRMVAATPVGKDVEVVYLRKGKETTATVKLGRLEDGEKQANLAKDSGVEKPVARKALGLDLSSITDDLRRRYSIKDDLKGVVVTRVDPNSSAADKRIQSGDVIMEVGQESVSSPADVTKRVEALKKDGKKSALLLVANAQGEVRFVAVTIE